MATLRIHGTAIFKRKCIATRNVGPVISEGWGIFKRTHQETETKPLIERSDLEFKNLEIDLDLGSLKKFCSDKRCNSLNEFVSSELFATFLFENNQISLFCDEMMYAPPWGGFDEVFMATGDDFLDMSRIEDERADFYSDCEPGEYPKPEQGHSQYD